ncbi:OLC1v1006299C2 [Oldenlandia corymbosa var. corymbosa]|uniref:OLC1v1006299C2 n=1 Tax=Oldenlandia corymbosa var. corymbosa TaxID=529605 RepID=A0AAV1DGN1_OLDCO|nr:OLC1v1006299C2 [Oldenlandia corymbosa var. corymbosa]
MCRVLRNNSFSGIVPKQIGELKELEVLDLGYNNFSGPFPLEIGKNQSVSILLINNNRYIGNITPDTYDGKTFSGPQVTESSTDVACGNRLSKSSKALQQGDTPLRRFLKGSDSKNSTEKKNKKNGKKSSPSSSETPAPSPSSPLSSPSEPPSSISSPPFTSFDNPSPSPSPSPSDSSDSSSMSRSPLPSPIPAPSAVIPEKSHPSTTAPAPAPAPIPRNAKKTNKHLVFVLAGVLGGSALLFVSVLSFLYCRNNKVVTVRPWATGLSGQLQKAFVTGVPKLQRSELEVACEDFSNIIGALSDGTVYKGTLSSGVEIAVTSTAVKSAKDWSKNLEIQFRHKIDTLTRINHKNFVNLIGYCEDEMPFTRMMVFEYAPNGTLFEHLHIKESEPLDWSARLRIAMGIAYCLEYMHQLNPPIAHWNLQSSSIYLTEDYAAKMSDFCIWNEVIAAKMGSETMKLLETPSADDPASNVFNFGVIMLEMLTGRLPMSADDGSLADWARDYSRKGRPFRDIVDPTFHSFRNEEVEKLFKLVQDCLHPDSEERPSMKEVVARLKEITTIEPDGATPKTSPLWWAEVEIMSTA